RPHDAEAFPRADLEIDVPQRLAPAVARGHRLQADRARRFLHAGRGNPAQASTTMTRSHRLMCVIEPMKQRRAQGTLGEPSTPGSVAATRARPRIGAATSVSVPARETAAMSVETGTRAAK